MSKPVFDVAEVYIWKIPTKNQDKYQHEKAIRYGSNIFTRVFHCPCPNYRVVEGQQLQWVAPLAQFKTERQRRNNKAD